MSKMQGVSLNLSKGDLAKLRLISRSTKRSVGDEMRVAIRDHIERNKDKLVSVVVFEKKVK